MLQVNVHLVVCSPNYPVNLEHARKGRNRVPFSLATAPKKSPFIYAREKVCTLTGLRRVTSLYVGIDYNNTSSFESCVHERK